MVSGSGSVVDVGAVVLRWLGGQNGVELALRIGQHLGGPFDLLCGAEPPDLADLSDEFGDMAAEVASPAAAGVVPRVEPVVAAQLAVLGESRRALRR